MELEGNGLCCWRPNEAIYSFDIIGHWTTTLFILAWRWRSFISFWFGKKYLDDLPSFYFLLRGVKNHFAVAAEEIEPTPLDVSGRRETMDDWVGNNKVVLSLLLFVGWEFPSKPFHHYRSIPIPFFFLPDYKGLKTWSFEQYPSRSIPALFINPIIQSSGSCTSSV